MSYGVVHTTNVLNAKPVSLINMSADLENGFFAMDGGTAAGETQISIAAQPTTATISNKVLIIANPAWSYDDSRATNQNEEEFINKKGKSFRAYDSTIGNKFTITAGTLIGTPKLNSYVVAKDGSWKGEIMDALVADVNYGFIGQITEIKDLGYFYTIGQYGTEGTYTNGTGDTVSLGTGEDMRTKMVTFKVIKNG